MTDDTQSPPFPHQESEERPIGHALAPKARAAGRGPSPDCANIPLFRMVLRDGRSLSGDLAALLAACDEYRLAAVECMQEAWRLGVVTHLAALLVVLPRHSGPLMAEEDWRAALAHHLPGAIPGAWAFPQGMSGTPVALAGAGPASVGWGHDIKPVMTASADLWALASMGGLVRENSPNKRSLWTGGAWALVGDGTLASETLMLAEAFRVHFRFGPRRTVAEHFPGWLAPVSRPLTQDDLPSPCVWHQRPVRPQNDGSALQIARGMPEIVDKAAFVDLPHRARERLQNGTKYVAVGHQDACRKADGGIPWSARVQTAIVAGVTTSHEGRVRSDILRPRLLDFIGRPLRNSRDEVMPEDDLAVVRLIGVGTTQGKTEVVVRVVSGALEGARELAHAEVAQDVAKLVLTALHCVEKAIQQGLSKSDPRRSSKEASSVAGATARRLTEVHGGSEAAEMVMRMCSLASRADHREPIRRWARRVFESVLREVQASVEPLRAAAVRLRAGAVFHRTLAAAV